MHMCCKLERALSHYLPCSIHFSMCDENKICLNQTNLSKYLQRHVLNVLGAREDCQLWAHNVSNAKLLHSYMV